MSYFYAAGLMTAAFGSATAVLGASDIFVTKIRHDLFSSSVVWTRSVGSIYDETLPITISAGPTTVGIAFTALKTDGTRIPMLSQLGSAVGGALSDSTFVTGTSTAGMVHYNYDNQFYTAEIDSPVFSQYVTPVCGNNIAEFPEQWYSSSFS